MILLCSVILDISSQIPGGTRITQPPGNQFLQDLRPFILINLGMCVPFPRGLKGSWDHKEDLEVGWLFFGNETLDMGFFSFSCSGECEFVGNIS